MSNDEQLRVVVVSDEEVDLVAAAEAEGLERDDDVDIADLVVDPLSAAVIIGGGIALGTFVLHVIDRWRGGVHIDTKSDPHTIKRNRELPFGMVVVVAADGTVDVDVKDEAVSAPERLVTEILKLPVTATVDMVKAVIERWKRGDAPAP